VEAGRLCAPLAGRGAITASSSKIALFYGIDYPQKAHDSQDLKFRESEVGEGVLGLAAFAEAGLSRHPDLKFAGLE
jgi:hypothetical protein